VCLSQALDEASAISEGGVTDTLKNFLQLNMPKAGLNAVHSLLPDPFSLLEACCQHKNRHLIGAFLVPPDRQTLCSPGEAHVQHVSSCDKLTPL
jgi:hypothetical protein